MGKYFYAIVLAILVGATGFLMFPSMKVMIEDNSTTGFSYLLAALVTALPYAAAFFVGYAIWKAARGNRG